MGNQNLYHGNNGKPLSILAYIAGKLLFSLRMIKAAFCAIDEELEDAAKNPGASPVLPFLKVKLPIILPSVLAVFALNFNALFTEYDMSAAFASISHAMVIQSRCKDGGTYGYNANVSGRRCASPVFIIIASGIILNLVCGIGARYLGGRLDARDRRRQRAEKSKAAFR